MKKRRAKPAQIRAHMLVPGYFTELIRKHNWPPGFEPQETKQVRGVAAMVGTQAAIVERDRQASDGIGWGSGIQTMYGTPKSPRPGWIGKSESQR